MQYNSDSELPIFPEVLICFFVMGAFNTKIQYNNDSKMLYFLQVFCLLFHCGYLQLLQQAYTKPGTLTALSS